MYATRSTKTHAVNVHLFTADSSPFPRPVVNALSSCDRIHKLAIHRDLNLQRIGSWPRGIRLVYVPERLGDSFAAAADRFPRLDDSPLVVVSDGPAPAIAAFEFGAVDFLVTPVTGSRLQEAIDRCVERARPAGRVLEKLLASLQTACGRNQAKDDVIVCRSPKTVQLIPVGEVRWIEGDRNYFKLHSDAGIVRKRGSLSRLEKKLPSQFHRVHRSAIVNLEKVVRIDRFANATGQAILDDGSRVPISRGRRLSALTPTGVEGR